MKKCLRLTLLSLSLSAAFSIIHATAQQMTPAGQKLNAPVFSVRHGFFGSPFYLSISAEVDGAVLFFTTNGSEPSETNGIRYSSPVLVDSSTVFRVIAVKGSNKSDIATSTYLFYEDILHQPERPSGYPASWGNYTAISGTAVADYGMDQEILSDPASSAGLIEALRSIPSVSVATSRDFLFSNRNHPDSGGIYVYTGAPLTNTTNATGFDWERPASMEYFDAAGNVSLQVNCGLQLHGGHSRRAEKSPKHSLRLEFKERYGPSRLRYPVFGTASASSYNSLVLRAGFNNTWVHHASSERLMAQYIQDAWAKDIHKLMGHKSSNGFFIHLFINGLYWGIYSLSEKIDEDLAASFSGGNPEEYDVIKDYTEVASGNILAWNRMMSKANAGLSGTVAYQQIQGNNPDGTRDYNLEPLVDVVSLADYMLLNFYAGNSDWDHHNWVAMRNRVNPGKGFRFYAWDEEKILENVSASILGENNPNCPSRVFQQLRQNADFRRLFADRVQKFCFDGGPLTARKSAEVFSSRSLEIEDAIIAESARWGDYRRDVHKWQEAGPFDIYTYDRHWIAANSSLMTGFFPARTNIFIGHLRNAGLFPAVDAPSILLNGKAYAGAEALTGDTVTIYSSGGTVYFTTDGRDPVAWSGTAGTPSAGSRVYSGPVILKSSMRIKARVNINGTWSAISEKIFTLKGDYRKIRITEINYHPEDQDTTDDREFEFIELKNTGTGTLDAGGLKLTGGIEFWFEPETYIGPGEFIVLASNPGRFRSRYGFEPKGEYTGQLGNSGDTIILTGRDGDTLSAVGYLDGSGWPSGADGTGGTLVPVDLNPAGNQDNPGVWRLSYHKGGSPGADDLFQVAKLETGEEKGIVVLYQNFPNPFENHTDIAYTLKEEAGIDISVYNIFGIRVRTLQNSTAGPGSYVLRWSGNDDSGRMLPGGTYLVRLSVKGARSAEALTRKMLLLR